MGKRHDSADVRRIISCTIYLYMCSFILINTHLIARFLEDNEELKCWKAENKFSKCSSFVGFSYFCICKWDHKKIASHTEQKGKVTFNNLAPLANSVSLKMTAEKGDKLHTKILYKLYILSSFEVACVCVICVAVENGIAQKKPMSDLIENSLCRKVWKQ